MPDNNIFENGWNKHNAYAFGWIMSDGCLRLEGRNRTAYAVRVCSNDKDVIDWLHEYLCVGNKIYKQGEKGYLIKFRNIDSIKFMMRHGLKERKSLDMQFPEIPVEYIGDFIRGYFDGDGSVVLRKTKYNTYAQVSFTCASLDFLTALKDRLEECRIASNIYMDGRATNNSYYLKVTKRSEIEKLYKLMYADADQCAMLTRKHEKYLMYLDCKPKYNVSSKAA